MINEVHLGDIGTQFILTIYDENATVVNLASATELTIYFTPPSGAVLSKTASLYTDGTDGKIYYVTITGDLSVAGRWKYQAKVVLPNGSWKSDIGEFEVYRNLV